MALRVKKVEFGTFKGGKFRKNPRQPKMPKLGSGKRFERCVAEVTARGGAYDPQAVCAARGIRKYGKKRMLKLARKGKARHRHNPFTMMDAYAAGQDSKAPNLSAAVKQFNRWYLKHGPYTQSHVPKDEYKRGFINGWRESRFKHLDELRSQLRSQNSKTRHRSARARNRVKRARHPRKAPNRRRKIGGPGE